MFIGTGEDGQVRTIRCLGDIEPIPHSIAQSLEELHLRPTRGLRDLSRTIGQLQALRIMNLAGASSLASLPEEIGISPQFGDIGSRAYIDHVIAFFDWSIGSSPRTVSVWDKTID